MAQKGLEEAVEALRKGLEEALGGDLVSLILYGSAARGTHEPGRSDVNVLLVVREAAAAVLERMAPALRAWTMSGRVAPLIQTEAEWKESADVFPIEIEDIREAHRLLAGRDVVSGLATARENLRIQLERESRSLLLRLRARYTVTGGDGRALAALLIGAIGPLLVLLRAALRLAGKRTPAEPAALVTAASQLMGCEGTGWEWALRARSESRPALKPYDPVAAEYLETVGRFVEYVNNVEDEREKRP